MSHGPADAGNSLLTRLARHARLWLIPLSVLVALLPLEGLLRLFPSLLPPDAQQRVLWTMQTPAKSVGDRMAYGYGVAHRDAWPALLGEALPTLRVITLGMPGAVPQQYTRLFEGKVPSRHTDLLERSYLLQALQRLRKGLTYGFSGTTVPLLDGGQVRLAPILYAESLRHNHPGDPGFDAVVRAAVEARERARSIDSRFVVLFVPTKEFVYLPFLRAPFPGVKGPLMDVLARKKDMTIVDLTEPLREQAALGKQVYFEIDGHPNELGNRVIADTLAKWLRENAQSLALRAVTPSDG